MTYSAEILADTPAAYYRLDETSGTTLTDSSGNSRNGTYSVAPTSAAGLVPNDANASVDFPTVGPARVANAAWMNSLQFTSEVWFRYDTINTTASWIFARSSAAVAPAATGRGWWIQVSPGGLLNFGLRFNDGTALEGSAGKLVAGSVYHAVLVWNGTQARFFLNGMVVYSNNSYAGKTISHPTADITIAGDHTNAAGVRFDGRIDEAAYYTKALTYVRIRAHYSLNKNGTAGSGLANETKINLLKALTGRSPSPYTYPLTVKLMRSYCDGWLEGTECDSNEYEEQPILWETQVGTSFSRNRARVRFSSLDSDDDVDIYGLEVWDSSVDEKRVGFESFATPVTVPADYASVFEPLTLGLFTDDGNDMLTNTAEDRLMRWFTGKITTAPFTAPLQIRLMTTNGSEATKGVECAGNLYKRQWVYWSNPQMATNAVDSYAYIKNTTIVTFSALSSSTSTTITGYELWDNSATPIRVAFQNYGSGTAVAANTPVTFAIAALEMRVL